VVVFDLSGDQPGFRPSLSPNGIDFRKETQTGRPLPPQSVQVWAFPEPVVLSPLGMSPAGGGAWSSCD
jgi:hypothetical protein